MTDEYVPPDDAAYGRVTNPERFRPLHQFARDLVAELVRDYMAETGPGTVDDFDPRRREFIDEVVRVWPTTGEGGPISIAFSAFPGLFVRFGRWHDVVSPGCGCDACDEQADIEMQLLRRQIADYVDGRLVETLDHDRLGFSVRSPDGNRSGWTLVRGSDFPDIRQPFSHTWPAWRRRDE